MDIQGSSNNYPFPSAQTVTSVTPRVEGEGLKSSIEDSMGLSSSKNIEQMANLASVDQLKTQVDKLNQTLEQSGQSITFGIDETTQTPVIEVKDRSTDELIRQLPSEDSLKMMQQIQDYLDRAQASGDLSKEGLTGSLFNEII